MTVAGGSSGQVVALRGDALPAVSSKVFADVIALAPAAIAVLEGPDHRYAVVNAAYRRLARGKGVLLGRTLAEVWPESGHAIVEVLDRVYATGEPFEAAEQPFEVQRDRGPERIRLTFSFLPMRGEAGAVERILVMADEVTAHVEAVEALRASNELTAALSRALTRAEVARTVFEKGLAVFGADAGALGLVPPDAPDQVELVEQFGYPAPLVAAWRRFPLALRSPLTDAVRAAEPVWVTSPREAQARYPEWAPAVAAQPDRAWAALPLVARGRILGALALSYYVPRTFDEGYRGALASVAERCAQALDRAQVVDDLRRRAAELEAVLEAVPTPVFITRDLEARTIHANAAAQALLALPPGGNASMRDTPRDAAAFVPMRDGVPLPVEEMPMQAAARFGREVRDFEYDILRRDGSLRRVVANARPIVDANGARRGAVGAFIDVTARRQAEQAVRENEARLRAFVEAGLFGVVFSDVHGNVTDCNDELARIIGRTREEVRAGAVRWTEITPPEDLALDARAIAEAQARGRCTPYEKRYRRPDGTLVPVEIGFVLLEPERRAAVAFVLDVTDRKAAEDRLREADRRKTEFLAVLSHELRNPLTPIRNGLALLERAPPGSPAAARARAVLDRQTAHLARLVDDLLDVTRITHGKVTLQRSRIDLREVVRRAGEDHRAMFEAVGVALRVELADGASPVDADAARVTQVLGNLLQNAARFTPAGGAVTLALRAAGGAVELAVRDTGVGIAPADLARLFEPFAQAAQGLARSQGGLGLGLAIVRGLVELHGGTVEARSDGVGRGAEFTVRLPAAPDLEPRAPDRQ